MTEFIKCHIKILSPVHLGCDEVYDPLSFSVDTEKKILVVFDPVVFLSELKQSDKSNFSEICKKGTPSSILEIYKFIKGKKTLGKEVSVSDGFVTHYNETLALRPNDNHRIQKQLNRFIIERTAFLPTSDMPYIPGSAVKGSFRTAYLNFLCKDKKCHELRTGNGSKLEEFLLGGSFSKDPLRFVKVSDFMPVGDVKTRIVYAANEKKKVSEFGAPGPYQILEVIQPRTVFQGTIMIDKPLPEAKINKPVKLEDLCNSLRDFFAEELKREQVELARINHKHALESVEHDAKLFRIGRHSGAECVTIAAVRSILIRGAKDKSRRENKATTLWLAADAKTVKQSSHLEPFGWASFHITDEDTQKVFAEEESKRQQTLASGTAVHSKQKLKFTEPARLEIEEWTNAGVTWNPGNGEIKASHGQKNAVAKDINLVAEGLRDKLKKKKTMKALVKVSHEAGTFYRILSVEPAGGN